MIAPCARPRGKQSVGALIAALTTLVAPGAGAYEAYPLHPVHETLTHLALQCLDRYQGARPIDCRPEAARVQVEARWRLFRRFTAEEKASTWADDPARELAPLTFARFAMALKDGCALAAAEAEGDYSLDRSGLMCGSHYGQLQFLHAMRSRPEESFDDSLARIGDWAGFTFAVAAGHIAPEQPYCRVFAVEAPAIADDMAPAECATRRLYGDQMGDWTVATLFSRRCGHILASRRCLRLDLPNASIQMTAQGALLHLVQDSYSQSHAVRGPIINPFDARIDCAAVSGFHFYDAATAPSHRAADRPPVLAASCSASADTGVDDVVTASATAIWMMRQRVDRDLFSGYLQAHVLGVAQGAA
jgi:hypothetical protein